MALAYRINRTWFNFIIVYIILSLLNTYNIHIFIYLSTTSIDMKQCDTPVISGAEVEALDRQSHEQVIGPASFELLCLHNQKEYQVTNSVSPTEPTVVGLELYV